MTRDVSAVLGTLTVAAGSGFFFSLLLCGLTAHASGIYRGSAIELGRPRRILIGKWNAHEGGAVAFFMSPNDRPLAQFGIYDEVPENPLLGLSDDLPGNGMKNLIRLAGDNHSGVVVLKTKSGGDGLVMGLELSGTNENPYFSCARCDGMLEK